MRFSEQKNQIISINLTLNNWPGGGVSINLTLNNCHSDKGSELIKLDFYKTLQSIWTRDNFCSTIMILCMWGTKTNIFYVSSERYIVDPIYLRVVLSETFLCVESLPNLKEKSDRSLETVKIIIMITEPGPTTEWRALIETFFFFNLYFLKDKNALHIYFYSWLIYQCARDKIDKNSV